MRGAEAVALVACVCRRAGPGSCRKLQYRTVPTSVDGGRIPFEPASRAGGPVRLFMCRWPYRSHTEGPASEGQPETWPAVLARERGPDEEGTDGDTTPRRGRSSFAVRMWAVRTRGTTLVPAAVRATIAIRSGSTRATPVPTPAGMARRRCCKGGREKGPSRKSNGAERADVTVSSRRSVRRSFRRPSRSIGSSLVGRVDIPLRPHFLPSVLVRFSAAKSRDWSSKVGGQPFDLDGGVVGVAGWEEGRCGSSTTTWPACPGRRAKSTAGAGPCSDCLRLRKFLAAVLASVACLPLRTTVEGRPWPSTGIERPLLGVNGEAWKFCAAPTYVRVPSYDT